MALIDKFKFEEYKNEDVAEAVLAMCNLQTYFEQRKSGQALSGILLQLSRTFPEEQNNILKLFTTAATPPTLKSRTRVVSAKKTGVAQTGPDGQPCPTCPGGGAVPPLETVARDSTAKAIDPETVETGVDKAITLLSQAKTWRDVISAFGGNAEDMMEYAKMEGINIGKVTKAGTIAKRIYDHIVSEGLI